MVKVKRFYLRDVAAGALVSVVGAPELRARVVRKAEGPEPGSVTVRTQGGVVTRTFTANAATKDEQQVTLTGETGRTVQWSAGTRVEIEGGSE